MTDDTRTRLDAPVLRLTGQQIGSIEPPPDGDWFVDFDEYEEFVPKRMLDAARQEQDELRAAADPYTSFAEHRRQEDAGTHLFDPQCPFCFFLHFDSEERAELAADAGKGLDRE